MRVALAVLFLASVPTLSTASAADLQRGEELFRRCAACHSAEPDTHRVGPSLAGVVGRQAGTARGFRYSPVMVDFGTAGVVWDEDTLDSFLAAPQGLIQGTRMTFPGLREDKDRADVIEFLKTLSAP